MWKVILLAFLMVFPRCKDLYALEIKTDCSDIKVLQKYWSKKYYHQFYFGDEDHKATKLVCNDDNYRAAKVLWLLDKAKTESGHNYYEEVRRINAPYTIGSSCSKITSFGCPSFDLPFAPKEPEFNYAFNLIYRLALLLHETRHIQMKEAGNHVLCAGKTNDESCDEEFIPYRFFANTFSYEIIYLLDIMNNNKFDENTRLAIAQYLQYIITTKFNKAPNYLIPKEVM